MSSTTPPYLEEAAPATPLAELESLLAAMPKPWTDPLAVEAATAPVEAAAPTPVALAAAMPP